ncbi:MAG: 4Fe-4S dicluster domain-containing protein [Acidobacteriota bacterium]|nr:4Fe-4S dicluster domain-containing protein [Blastocatellia bacterium]MDW8238915.1 4Fe-4S dicluster domain-containing protein [Acidobacteriota bacterium]
MRALIHKNNMQEKDLLREVEELSGQNLYACYQCGKCTAGCPLAFSMDILPHTIIRLMQLGQLEPVLSSNTPWHCAACLTCSSRCPKGVDLARVMEALRALLIRAGYAPIQVFRLPAELAAQLPQQAAVSALRKHSG